MDSFCFYMGHTRSDLFGNVRNTSGWFPWLACGIETNHGLTFYAKAASGRHRLLNIPGHIGEKYRLWSSDGIH